MEVKHNSNLVLYENEKLKLKLEQLKLVFKKLNIKKNSYIKKIDDFNSRYASEFKTILDEILRLRIKKCKKEFLTSKSYYDELVSLFNENKESLQNLKQDTLHDNTRKINQLNLMLKNIKQTLQYLNIKDIKINYQEAYSDYHDFLKTYKDKEEKVDLSLSDEKELKIIYKKASKLCHPDMVDISKLEDAQEFFIELNEAYKSKNLKMVKDIFIFLDGGKIFKKEDIELQSIEKISLNIISIKKAIKNLLAENNHIRYENEYSFVFDINNMDDYFTNIKNQLQNQLEELKNTKLSIKKDKKQWFEKLISWANKYKIDDSIFPRDIEKLKLLTSLDLSHLDLDFICNEFSNLTMLVELDLSYNKLDILPQSFKKIKKLKTLNLSNNKFLEVPNFIFDFELLKSLDISVNNIEEFDIKLNKNYELEKLLCSKNKFTIFPKDVCLFTKLQILDFGGNFIKNLPDKLVTLKNLKKLSLWGNDLTELNNSICELVNLQYLNLGSNQLSLLPKDILNLTKLNELELFMNNELVLNEEQKRWEENINPSLF